jgi:hypothetical protein
MSKGNFFICIYEMLSHCAPIFMNVPHQLSTLKQDKVTNRNPSESINTSEHFLHFFQQFLS